MQLRFAVATKLLKLQSNSHRPCDMASSNSPVHVGIVHYNEENFADALLCFQEACAQDPADEYPFWWLGRCLQKLGRLSEAENAFRAASELSPDDAQNQFDLAKTLFDQRRFDEALPFFRRACALDSGEESYFQWLGQCLEKLDRMVEAEEAFRTACTLEPSDGDCHFLFAKFLFEQGNLEEAERFALRACELKPNSWEFHQLQGRVLHGLGRYHESEERFRCALGLNSGEASNYYWLGFSIDMQGRLEEANNYYVAAIQHAPHTAVAADSLNNLGVNAWLEEDKAAALSHLMEALRIQRVLVARGERAIDNLDENLRIFLHNSSISTDVRTFLQRMMEVEGRIREPRELAEAEVETGAFQAWLDSGVHWLDSANWRDREDSGFLRDLYLSGVQWATEDVWIFPEFDAGESEIEEALAFVDNLSASLGKEPDTPIYLVATGFSIAMTIEDEILRAWVGRENVGLAVSVDLNTWDLHYRDEDPDAIFAVAAVVHWFLDCSLGIETHPKFARGLDYSDKVNVKWKSNSNAWLANASFDADVESVLRGQQRRPPTAHRVRGHIRELRERRPTEESRSRAPAYIRRNMGPNDTWVASYSKGGEAALKRLMTRLATHSSLADYLSTCPRQS